MTIRKDALYPFRLIFKFAIIKCAEYIEKNIEVQIIV